MMLQTNQKHNNKYSLMMTSIILFLLIFLFVITACTAQYPLNTRIEKNTKNNDVQYTGHSNNEDSDLILILAFSGGGTRAASLAYGTLEVLKQVEIPEQTTSPASDLKRKTMLDQISVITAVSGGSFTAAYYGLHGEGIFKDFRERFLLRDIQGDLILKYINPFNWPRLSSPTFGRSDLAQEYYDEILFNGATLANLSDANRPNIIILATDAIEGISFPFTEDAFSWICSDFNRFPVSRAVAASSAVPGILSPVILRNYSKNCRREIPLWIQESLDNPDQSDRTYQMAVRANSYLDQNKTPYIFLVDGVISDNLGLRTIIDRVTAHGGMRDILAKSARKGVRRIAFIIVDAETKMKPSWSIMGNIPGIGAILDVSSTIMVNRYNFETIALLKRSVQDWQKESAAGNTPIDFYLIHVTFNSLPEKSEQEYFHSIPTSLSLSAYQVDRLRKVAAQLLYSSPEFKRLVHDVNGRITVPLAEKSIPTKSEKISPQGVINEK